MPAPIDKGPFLVCARSGKVVGFCRRLRWLQWAFPVAGFFALLWHLARVVPKPSRATYPCQQVAGPLAWGFVAWLASFPLAVLALRKAGRNFLRARYILACLFFVMFAVAGIVGIHSWSESASATPWTPTDAPNSPIGVARGIYPGRVVWTHDPAATLWDGASTDYWWSTANTDQTRVDAMLSQSLHSLTGATTDAAAWTALFQSFNNTHGRGSTAYTAGQKIVIKINQNTARSGHPLNGNTPDQNSINGSPHLILSMLKQLVNNADAAQGDITVYDASRYIGDSIYVPCHAAFPNVHFMDESGGDGRDLEVLTSTNVVTYAKPNGCGTKMPTAVTAASYMIDMAIMKNHGNLGPTLSAKNHYGTVNGQEHTYTSGDSGMAAYTPMVELLGHKYLGQNTVLFMIDTLYGAPGPDAEPSKWNMAPFNGAWPASLLLSQDPVAIDSVGFDFINAEWGCYQNTDNYLHESALANNPPSGILYAPNGDGARLPSLGVHEHWNNSTAKQYSRNLGTGNGIELVTVFFPAAPTGFNIAPGSGQVAMTWAAGAGDTSYNVKRATVPGGPYTTIASPTGTSYTDSSVQNGTAYYYVISGSNSLGESPNSTEISARPGAFVAAVNCGGSSAGQFAADEYYTGGGVGGTTTNFITTTGLIAPAPQAVYQTERYGNTFSYTITGLTPGVNYTIRLHFDENYWSSTEQRVFSVAINGTTVLSKFDIIAATGAKYTAIIKEFPLTAPANGQALISFSTTTDNAKCSGIEVLVAPPSAPASLSVTANSGTQATLTWKDNANNETGYVIERASDSAFTVNVANLNGPPVLSGSGSYVDTGLVPGAQYYYQVCATGTGGCSAYTNPANITMPSPPIAPSGLQATFVSTSAIDLLWNDNSNNENGFYLYLVDQTTGTQNLIATFGANTTSYNDLNLSAGTDFHFDLQSYNIAGCNGPACLEVTTLCAAPASPSATPGPATVTLRWNPPAGAVTYNVYRSTASCGEGATPYLTGLLNTSFTDSNVAAGTQYFYRVSAVNDSGAAGTLSAETFATPAAAPGVPAMPPWSVAILALAFISAAALFLYKRACPGTASR